MKRRPFRVASGCFGIGVVGGAGFVFGALDACRTHLQRVRRRLLAKQLVQSGARLGEAQQSFRVEQVVDDADFRISRQMQKREGALEARRPAARFGAAIARELLHPWWDALKRADIDAVPADSTIHRLAGSHEAMRGEPVALVLPHVRS